MNDSTPLSARVRAAFGANPHGVVGVTDELLLVCRERPLRLDWEGGRCLVRSAEEAVEIVLPKSAFRAILARLAALCNEGAHGGVTPYGGSGELTREGNAFRVTLVNTPGEQTADVRLIGAKVGAVVPPVPVGDSVPPVTSPNSA